MRKLLEVKEFEQIIGNKDFKSQYRCIDENDFKYLTDFIYSFNPSNEESDILDFVKMNYKRNVGKIVSFKNYVGLIQLENGFQIQILPKIMFVSEEKDQTKQVFIKMLCSMKEFPCKTFKNGHLMVEHMNLYEIFINMYLQESRQLIKKGMKSSYLQYEDNLTVYKGKLIVNEHIKHNLGRKERFYMEYDEYHINRPENKLIKATLLKLQKVTKNAKNAKEIRQLLNFFESVQPSINYSLDFSKVIIDRHTKDYEMLMKWSKVFLMNKSFTPFSGSESAKTLLFPMEKVFESYVAENIIKVFGKVGWKVSVQDKNHYLFDTFNGKKYNKFSLRPDIVVTRDDESVIILDTKWKKLTLNEKRNFGISQADMYQMYAYSKKYNTSEIWLLYPINEEMKNYEQIKFESGDGVNVSVFFVDVSEIEKSLGELLKCL